MSKLQLHDLIIEHNLKPTLLDLKERGVRFIAMDNDGNVHAFIPSIWFNENILGIGPSQWLSVNYSGSCLIDEDYFFIGYISTKLINPKDSCELIDWDYLSTDRSKVEDRDTIDKNNTNFGDNNMTENEWDKIQRRLAKLEALEAGGADNWSGYDVSLAIWRKENELEEELDSFMEQFNDVLAEAKVTQPSERGAGYMIEVDESAVKKLVMKLENEVVLIEIDKEI